MFQPNPQLESYHTLKPRHTATTIPPFKLLPLQNFHSNYFQIEINPRKSIMYQYDYRLEEAGMRIERGSGLYGRVVRELRMELVGLFGYEMQIGQMLYGTKCQESVTSLYCQIKVDGVMQKLQAIFKKVKQINLKDLQPDNNPIETKSHLLQLYNINLKNRLKNAGLVEMGKSGKYFHCEPQIIEIENQNQRQKQDNKQISQQQQTQNQDEQQLYSHKKQLQVIQGYKISLIPFQNIYALLIDVCFRVMQHNTFLNELKTAKKSLQQTDLNEKYRGCTVTANYGNFKNYKIVEIDFGMNPRSRFVEEDGNGQREGGQGEEITYVQYYRRHYHIKVKDMNQPMVKVLIKEEKILGKNMQFGKKQTYGYLIPELISLSGISESQASQPSIMKALSNITKLTPHQRIQHCKQIISSLNCQNQLIQITKPIYLQGQTLNPPNLHYQAQKPPIQPDKNGLVKKLSVNPQSQSQSQPCLYLKQPAEFKKQEYLFIYSQGKHPKQDDRQADNAVYLLQQSGKIYGVKFGRPAFFAVCAERGVEEWISLLREDCGKNGVPQIVVFFLGAREEGYYGILKKFVVNQLRCPSQVIRRKTFKNLKKSRSAFSKLIIQMNAKIGLVPWEVEKRHSYFKKKSVMYCGYNVTSGKNGNYISFVGTINKQCTKYFSTCLKIPQKQHISLSTFQQLFYQWSKQYFLQTQTPPSTIIIYRQGLNQRQARHQIQSLQLPALQATIKKISQKTRTPNYNPGLVVILVNKKISERFYAIEEGQRGSGRALVGNPLSGSFVTEGLGHGGCFQLVAQYVTEGTCTPARFRILYDDSDMPMDAVINFTYQQCFNYYNWQGAVRLPSCLQYAHKLSKMCSESINESIQQSNLNKLLFYL